MNKSKRKKQIYNQEVISALSSKYSLTKRYIRQCLGGERKNITADRIIKEYKKMIGEIEKVITKNQEL